jgi:hypothetical protein
VKVNAVPSFADMGPARVFVSRSSRREALDATSSSAVFARVVVEGWTRKVAATARCCGHGTYTGVGGVVPVAIIFRSRFKPCASCPVENISLIAYRISECGGGRETDRASLRRKCLRVGLVQRGGLW